MDPIQSPHGPCPICGSGLIKQAYGYPLLGQLEAAASDPWTDLAGCVLDEASPAFLCRDHAHPVGKAMEAEEDDDGQNP